MRRILLLALAILALCAARSSFAAHRGNSASVVATTCPQGTADTNDGCGGANPNAAFKNASFFTTVQQSGQGPYAARPAWNVAGVDYPVGAEADTGLLSIEANIPSGCTLSIISHQLQGCTSDLNISGYRFNGFGISLTGRNISIDNSHFTMTADNCRNYTGSGMLRTAGGGAVGITITNSTFDFDSTCAFNSPLYKTGTDPGLQTQATFPMSITSSTMTVSGSSVGKIRVGQYADWSGRSAPTQITALTAPTSATISSISISGNIATVTTSTAHGLAAGAGIIFTGQTSTGYSGQSEVISAPTSTTFTYQIPANNIVPTGSATGTMGGYTITWLSGASANGSTWTVVGTSSAGSATATTGPVQTTMNGPIATGGSGPLVLKYNANLDSGQFASSSNEVDARFNFEKIITVGGQHINFIFNSPSPGTTNSFAEEYNTVYWDQNQAAIGAGTGTMDYFTQKSAGTGQVTATLVSLSNNTIVANSSLFGGGGKNTNALVRYLSQSNVSSGVIRYTLTGGVMTVTSVTSGVVTAGYYAQCTACTIPVLISAFGGTCAGVACTGSGGTGTYLVSNNVDTATQTSADRTVSAYPGIITTLNVNNNYYDATGADGVYNFDIGNVPVGTMNSTGNVNMLTGNSCNWGGTCN